MDRAPHIARLDALSALLCLAADIERARLGDRFQSDRIARAPASTEVTRIRTTLDGSVNDTELEQALRDAGLASQCARCRTVKSFSVEQASGREQMRIDINVDASSDEAGGPIDLPRGSHTLLVQAGKPTARLAQVVRRLIASVAIQDAVEAVPAQTPSQSYLRDVEIRVLAKRRLPDIQCYHLLSEPNGRGDDSCSELQVVTWDAFLAKAEKKQSANR